MVILTSVWNDEYIGWFERGLLKSFKWPRNRAIIGDSSQTHWILNCRANEKSRIEALVKPIGCSYEFIDKDLFQGLKHGIEHAFAHNDQFLLAPPDNAFSEGCIENFLKIAKSQKGIVIATPHVRVNPSFLDDMDNHRTPPEMLNHAWRNLHGSWTTAHQTTGMNGCWHGGVFWRKIEDRMVAVTHRLPTAFVCNFTQDDMNYFRQQGILGVWDNCWPPSQLINQQRWRLMGSSDPGFVVEITHPGRNVPEQKQANTNEPDEFKGGNIHNWVNREFMTIFNFKDPI